MNRAILLLWSLAAFSTMSCMRSASPVSASLVIKNARVWTVDASRPEAGAVAVLDDRIVRVGSDSEISALQGAGTLVLDAGGRLVLPGFNDDHVHFTQGGLDLLGVHLRDAASPEEFARRIGDYAKTRPRGEWILGGDWDHESWPGTPLPTRSLIDALTPENPVFVNRLDGHMSLANSLALKLAGITRATKDPDGGTVVHDAAGEPTGVLKDAAADLVERMVPPASAATLRSAVLAALKETRTVGLTSVQDMSSPEQIGIYQELLRSGELTVRMNCRIPLPDFQKAAALGVQSGFGGAYLRIGGVKGFADGSLGSTTALFFEPYNDDGSTAGLPAPMMFPEGNMKRLLLAADTAHLQASIHAIGDRANHEVLTFFEQVAAENPKWDRRFRIEHAQHLRPADIPAFSRIGVIASMQPYHTIDDGRWAEKRIGIERCRFSYAFRSLLDAGAHVAFGSDWYVAPLNPLLGIYAAVTRRTLDGKNPGGWIPEQKITVAEAVKAYTWTPAYATFEEDSKGSIAPGKLADFVVLSDDIFTIPPEKIGDARVLCTIVGGKIVYRAGI